MLSDITLIEIAYRPLVNEAEHESLNSQKISRSFNTLRLSEAYMRQYTKTSLVEMMAWRLFGVSS